MHAMQAELVLQLSRAQKLRYRNAFRQFDTDNSGAIDRSELRAALHSLGKYPDEKALQSLIDAVDEDENGSISFDEFCIMMSKYGQIDRQKCCHSCFCRTWLMEFGSCVKDLVAAARSLLLLRALSSCARPRCCRSTQRPPSPSRSSGPKRCTTCFKSLAPTLKLKCGSRSHSSAPWR